MGILPFTALHIPESLTVARLRNIQDLK
jgi:hypothetical protein